jgi:hypothetical protein
MAPSDVSSTTSSRDGSGRSCSGARSIIIETEPPKESRKRKRSRWGARLDQSIDQIINNNKSSASVPTYPSSSSSRRILPSSGEYTKRKLIVTP